jgi:hypothetical protein
MRDWASDLENAIVAKANGNVRFEGFVRANVASVKQLLRGIGPDEPTRHRPVDAGGSVHSGHMAYILFRSDA